MRTWTYKHGNNTICVTNRSHVAELSVNGELQDRRRGWFASGPMTGKLPTGEEIKVDLNGVLSIQCSLFIDNKLQSPIKK